MNIGKRFVGVVIAGLVLGMATPVARAHRIDGHISLSGLDFLEAQIPSYIPSHISLPPVTATLLTCLGGAEVSMTQRDTSIDLTVHSLDLSVPSAGTARISLTFSASAQGVVDFENPYFCFGSATCTDQLSVNNVTASIDFDVTVGVDGKPNFDVRALNLQAVPDDVSLTLSDCGALGSVLNFALDFGKQYFINALTSKLQTVVQTKVAPMLGDLLGGFTSFNGSFGALDVSASLSNVAVKADGLHISADVGLYSPSNLRECVQRDPGEPSDRVGNAPDLSSGPDTHLAVAVNLGLIDDVLYEGWRAKTGCFSDQDLRDAGYNVPIAIIGLLIPGFPTGTEFSMIVTYNDPPFVEGHDSSSAKLNMHMNNVYIDLTGTLPDGGARTLHLELDSTTVAEVGLDVEVNTLTMTIVDVTLTRFDVGDQQQATELGFDVVVMRQMLETEILPTIIRSWGKLPISGPVFNVQDYYVMIRQLSSSTTHLITKADLFRAPVTDNNAPDTLITSQPSGTVNPRTAKIRYAGTDVEIPGELLRYRVTIDGVERDVTSRREVNVGRAGETKTYAVSISAIDLKGNEDPTPVTTEVTVDGIVPDVQVTGSRSVKSDLNNVQLNWTMSDDVTATSALLARIEVYRVRDSGDVLDAEQVASVALAPGATRTNMDLETGQLYRLELYVTDEAGNEHGTTIMVQIGQLDNGEGGCSVSGNGTGTSALLLLLGMLVAVRRRRR